MKISIPAISIVVVVFFFNILNAVFSTEDLSNLCRVCGEQFKEEESTKWLIVLMKNCLAFCAPQIMF